MLLYLLHFTKLLGDTYKFWESGIEKQEKVIQRSHINDSI